MSVLAACRAGPSTIRPTFRPTFRQTLTLPISIQTRHKSFKHRHVKRKNKIEGANQIAAKEKEKPEKNENPGIFKPLPPSALTHEIFQTELRGSRLNLPIFNPDIVHTHMIGKATTFDIKDTNPSKSFGLPRDLLVEFRLLSKPCSVVRDVTVEAAEMLLKASKKSSGKTRVVYTGPPGCGKSFLLLQSAEYCASKEWIVLYIPRAANLVNSTTQYTYDIRTQTYSQPFFSYHTLKRFMDTNSALLSNLETTELHEFEKRPEIPVGTSLHELVSVALKERPLAPVILEMLIQELQKQTKYPVLLAIDDFQSLYCKSLYKDPHFSSIRPWHLSIPRMLLEFASGKRVFHRGAVVGAINASNVQFPIPLELREALGLPYDRPTNPGYPRRQPIVVEYTQGLRNFDVPASLSVPEAAALFEVWKDDGALTSSMYDELFMSKYAESSGNPRAFVRQGLLATMSSG